MAFVLTVAAVSLCVSSVAHAEKPLAPRITTTSPESSAAVPANSTTPQVLGEAEPEGGIIISAVGSSPLARGIAHSSGAKTPTKHPGYEILVFTQAGCQGAAVFSGRADTFEEAGISVTVAADAETMLSARQIDPSDPTHPSECSSPFSYWEGNVPKNEEPGGGGVGGNPARPPEAVDPAAQPGSSKPEPPRLRMSPAGRANDNEPLVAGRAPGAASVSIYFGPSCSGSPIAKGSAVQLAAGLQVDVADDTTTVFSAVSVSGQRSACSAAVTYVEDSTAPLTRITMGPGAKTRKRKAVFRFTDVTDDTPGTTFLCKLDRVKWKPCSSPLRLRHLRLSRHVVKVRAVDAAGNAEAKPVKRRFQVVRLP